MYKPLVSSTPAHSILNAQAFHYTSSVETDIRKTFARVRATKDNASTNATSNVRPLIKKEAEMLPPARAEQGVGRSRFSHAPARDVHELASDGGAAMTVLAKVLPMRRPHARRQLHSARRAAIVRSVDARSVSADRSAGRNTASRYSPPEPSAVADVSVWLECSGELMDVGSVDVLRIRETTPGIELVEFACPRCRTPHASLRFG